MKTLKQIIQSSEKGRIAIGHFNIAEYSLLKAIFEAAQDLRVPVIIGTSESEAKFLGRRQAAALVKSLREEYDFPIFLNSDHTRSFEEVKKAVAAGYDAILFDGATSPLEENIKQTKKVVRYIKSKNSEILVEGELGDIGSGSVIRNEISASAAVSLTDFTKSEDAVRFVKETGVDMLAPAVGNFHGMLARRSLQDGGRFAGYDYPLDIERIKAIKKEVKIPLVLHGGSGNTDADFLSAIEAGVNIIHISTELRVAWRKGLEVVLSEKQEEVAPYKLLSNSVANVKEVVRQRLQLFNKLK